MIKTVKTIVEWPQTMYVNGNHHENNAFELSLIKFNFIKNEMSLKILTFIRKDPNGNLTVQCNHPFM